MKLTPEQVVALIPTHAIAVIDIRFDNVFKRSNIGGINVPLHTMRPEKLGEITGRVKSLLERINPNHTKREMVLIACNTGTENAEKAKDYLSPHFAGEVYIIRGGVSRFKSVAKGVVFGV